MNGHTDLLRAKNAGGGAIGVEAVNTIPILHTGAPNPVAHDTQSQVPQQPAKPVQQAKKEKVSPDGGPLKTRMKKRLSDVASERQRFRPFKELESNQVFSQQAPQVSNPLFAATPGTGRVGTGVNTTLGNRFSGYASQIQQLIAQKWRTTDVDDPIQTAPVAVGHIHVL